MALLSKKSDADEKKILEEILKRENLLEERRGALDKWDKELKNREEELTNKLQQVTKLTPDEARQEVLKYWEQKLQKDIAEQIKAAETKVREDAKRRAQEILVDAMRHGATDYVAEYTVSTVKVADEEIKGRIIGKEGRNIRTFEKATGVDVDLDEAGVIRLSSFDPVRREIARVSLIRLIKDGRIQPVRIEEVINEVKKEIDRIIFEEGEKLAHTIQIYNLPQELISLLGRFKFRFSYGQNMIAHTLEETKIGISIAHELGLKVDIVKLGCLLHDIGKVVMDREGNHIELGVELLKRLNIPKEVIDCVASHHEDVPFASPEAVVVYIADSISGARPGARMEELGDYVTRMKEMEALAKEFPGVEEVYAMQAGREIRVIVNPQQLDDAQTMMTAQKIKEKIAQQYPNFPGSIKITLLRELQVTEIVK
ncbi:ribonuclease Y [Candidatus Roizmanbacteria bacterium]|nr:ribonuclease Y [Candidatus Roizmanbacteria bacterium]